MKPLSVLLLLTFLLAAGCGDGGGGNGEGSFRYVAIGASDATGIGATPITDGYVFRIERRLEEIKDDVSLLNLGIPGAEISEIKDVELEVAEEEDADLVTIFAGGNDIVDGDDPGSFEAALGEVLSRLRQIRPDSLIVIANLPDMTKLPRFLESPSPNITPARVAAFNTAIARQASANGALLVDLFSLGLTEALVSEDGFHPNNEGHRVIAQKFLEVIEPRLP